MGSAVANLEPGGADAGLGLISASEELWRTRMDFVGGGFRTDRACRRSAPPVALAARSSVGARRGLAIDPVSTRGPSEKRSIGGWRFASSPGWRACTPVTCAYWGSWCSGCGRAVCDAVWRRAEPVSKIVHAPSHTNRLASDLNVDGRVEANQCRTTRSTIARTPRSARAST